MHHSCITFQMAPKSAKLFCSHFFEAAVLRVAESLPWFSDVLGPRLLRLLRDCWRLKVHCRWPFGAGSTSGSSGKPSRLSEGLSEDDASWKNSRKRDLVTLCQAKQQRLQNRLPWRHRSGRQRHARFHRGAARHGALGHLPCD